MKSYFCFLANDLAHQLESFKRLPKKHGLARWALYFAQPSRKLSKTPDMLCQLKNYRYSVRRFFVYFIVALREFHTNNQARTRTFLEEEAEAA